MLMTTLTACLALQAAVLPVRPLPLADGKWEMTGDARIARGPEGRDELVAGTGFGFRRDVRLEDGTIEFDVQVTDRRSFVYVYFRAETDGEREEFYLRPHKSALPDAVQYAPVWQGRSAWQLYHGPGATAAPAFRHGEWSRVRVVVSGRRAALFIDDMATPALLVPRLARDPKAGYIALGGFLPQGVPGSGPIARFRDVSVTAGHIPYAFPASADAPRETGTVTTWAVSQAFAPPADGSVLPDTSVTGAFTPYETEPSGLLPLHRHVRVPPSGATAAVARVMIRAERAGTYAFDLGFSDVATVFVNGTPVFRGDGSYSFDRPRREGLIGFDNARIYLPLRAGDNELAVLLSDSFGGWGLMGRFADASGLTGLTIVAR